MRRIIPLSVLLLSVVSVAAGGLFATGVDLKTVEADGRSQKRTPKADALIALGRRLFFDPVVSRSAQRSCASCHDPDHGFSDPARVSDDDLGRTRRHSQTLIDSHRNPSAHWDGEFETIEELVLARIGAIKGRRGKLGHGTTLEAVVQEATGDPEPSISLGGRDDSGSGEEDEEEDILDDDDDVGGGDDDDTVYGETDRHARAAPAKPAGKTKDAEKGSKAPTTPGSSAPAAPAAGGAAPKPEAAAPQVREDKAKAEEPKAEAKAADKAKDGAQGAGGAKPKKKLTREEIKARAAKLRQDLLTLPLAHDVLKDGGLYDEAFTAAFGNAKVNTSRIARAIAAYCRSLESTESPYDRFAAGDASALSDAAKRGLSLFRGEAKCASCHTIEGPRPDFTDFGYHNTGVVWNRLTAKARARLEDHDETFKRRRDDFEAHGAADEGRARISTLRRDLRAFKTPTLRDVARRGPFMHDGRFKTLESVVAYYARGASPDPAKASHIRRFKASERDVADLVAFMESLTSDKRPGLPSTSWVARAQKTRLRFVDADGKPLVGVEVRLSFVGDRAHAKAPNARAPGALRTDRKGWIEFTNRSTTHTRITLGNDIAPQHGALVPDSCTKAKVVVPVRGQAEVVVHFPAGATPPTVLAAEHQGSLVLPGHTAPRTRLTKSRTVDMGRTKVVSYKGWLRTDVPSSVRLRLPGVDADRTTVTLAGDAPARIDLTTSGK